MARFLVFSLGFGLCAGLAAAPGARAGPVDPAEHWPLPPEVLERRLATEAFEVVSVSGGVGGVMGVKKLQIRLAEDGTELAVKWKKAPPGDADGWNNTPRKEIAAYEIQKWFLDPADYTVPTTVVRCIDFDTVRPIDPTPSANLPGTQCVIGALTIWINNVTVPDRLHDPERFDADPLYARHMADFNLLTYLIEHEDGREGNFLVSEFDEQRRIFSIDNGVAFGAHVKNFLVPNWHKIRVAGLRKESVERLRAVGPEQLDALGIVAEQRTDDRGVLRPVPHGSNEAPGKGARVAPGWIQLGLEDDEIEHLKERLRELLENVDAGRIETF